MLTIIANLKGGSGKSTVAFNVGVWLASHNVQVMMYDLDPQRTLTDVSEVRTEEGYDPDIKVKPTSRLREKDLNGDDREIIVDVGSGNTAGMKHALSLANRIVVPVPPSQADIWSTQRCLYLVSGAVSDKRPPPVWVFINRADTHHGVRESHEAAEALNTLPGIRVMKSWLYQRMPYRRSLSEGQAVFEMGRNTKAALEFHQFITELYPHVS